MLQCPLCSEEQIAPTLVGNRYGECPRCALRFLSPQFYLDEKTEKERYLLHSDEETDYGYQRYLRPLFEAIAERIPEPSTGLDFGSGRVSFLGRMLEKRGHRIERYDPFFAPNTELLNHPYDFVFATEVVEHFHHPAKEFQRLRALTKPGGLLGIMTQLYDGVDFDGWYYRRDPTHVVFYSKKTFHWIREHLGWVNVTFVGNKTIILSE